MQESALGSVFIFRGRSIGLDNYKSKESLSRGEDKEQIPRHKEINEVLARAIMRKWGL